MNWIALRQPAQRAVLAVLCACAAALATAAEIKVYQWRDAHGVTSYSQDPPASAAAGVSVQQIDFQKLSPAQRAAVKARLARLARLDARQQAEARQYGREVDAADRRVEDAVRALARSERALRKGRTPLPGERVGNAGGGSRLRADYFDRQKALDDAVQAAHADLAAADRQRAALTP